MRTINIQVYSILELKSLFPDSYKTVIEREQKFIANDDWYTPIVESLEIALCNLGFTKSRNRHGISFDLHYSEFSIDYDYSYAEVKPEYEIFPTIHNFHIDLNDIQYRYDNKIILSPNNGEYSATRLGCDPCIDDELYSSFTGKDRAEFIGIIKSLFNECLKIIRNNFDSITSEECICDNLIDVEFFENGDVCP
jgi:hypothetical protein